MAEKYFTDNPKTDSTADGALANLFRTIVTEDKLLPRIKPLVSSFAERTEHTKAGKNKCINNKMVHINNKKMSFKIFTMLLQDIFRVKKIELNITIFYSKDKVSNHSETIVLNDDD